MASGLVLKDVFSTYVEVIPFDKQDVDPNLRILHVCGGDPKMSKNLYLDIKYSPPMWSNQKED